MKPSSAKAKGRRAAAELRELLLQAAPSLDPGDIVVTPSGVNGPDLYLSPAAKKVYPFAIECKAVEALNVWSALKQAETHGLMSGGVTSLFPLLAFKRNRSLLYVSMRAEDFLKVLSKTGFLPHQAQAPQEDQ